MTDTHTLSGYCYTWTVKAHAHTLTDYLTVAHFLTDTHTEHCYTWTTKRAKILTDLKTDTHTPATAIPGPLRLMSTH